MFNIHLSLYYTITFKFTVFTSRNTSDIVSKQLAQLQREVYQSLKVTVRIVQIIIITEK
jgi:hypothetical protein